MQQFQHQRCDQSIKFLSDSLLYYFEANSTEVYKSNALIKCNFP